MAAPPDGSPFYLFGRVAGSEPLSEKTSLVRLVGKRGDRIAIVAVRSGVEPVTGAVVYLRVFAIAKGVGRVVGGDGPMSVVLVDDGREYVDDVDASPSAVDRYSPGFIREAARSLRATEDPK